MMPVSQWHYTYHIFSLHFHCLLLMIFPFYFVTLNILCVLTVDLSWAIITTAMVGKFLVNIPGTGTWLYTLETYPTSIRSIGVHTCSFAARVGAVGASYIGILVSDNYGNSERKMTFLMTTLCNMWEWFTTHRIKILVMNRQLKYANSSPR